MCSKGSNYILKGFSYFPRGVLMVKKEWLMMFEDNAAKYKSLIKGPNKPLFNSDETVYLSVLMMRGLSQATQQPVIRPNTAVSAANCQ